MEFVVGERCWAVVSVSVQKKVCLQEYIKLQLSDIAGDAGLSHSVTGYNAACNHALGPA